jgi:hypothetical protein
MAEAPLTTSQLTTPPHGWVQDLALREGPLSGQPDGQDELNHLDETYLEFSTASDLPRGISLFAGIGSLCLAISMVVFTFWIGFDFTDFKKYSFLENAFFLSCALLLVGSVGWMTLQGFRLDLQLPRDRPVRFNRPQAKIYINYFTWTHNPFAKWPSGVKVWDWNTVQACIAYRVGAAGEVVTQRYDLLLVSCKPGTMEVVDTFRLQQGAMTTRQYEDLWALLRHYMAKGLEDLPPQNLRNPNPAFIDCLLFAIPWFSPTEEGRRARARMKGFWGTVMMVLMSLLFPLWLLFGLGNYIVNKFAPEAVWPAGMDEQSRA